MPRNLGDELNELKITDNLSGGDIVLYYRTPTSEEQIAYTNQLVQRIRNKVVNRTGETRMKYGAKILEGFRDGDFIAPVNGQSVPISSKEGYPNYYPGWKELVTKKAPDLIEVLAMRVFEASAQVQDDEPDEPDQSADEDITKNC